MTKIGDSSLGRPMLLAAISSAENIANLDRYREISGRLAQVKGVSDAEAQQLAREGKAIIWIDGGLHATEVAHGQMTPELAHWLATDESDEARLISDQTIVLVTPNMNPDGLDIVAAWYEGNVGTEFETSPVPELYHDYIGHDNNRDWYMFTQAETRAVARQLYTSGFRKSSTTTISRAPSRPASGCRRSKTRSTRTSTRRLSRASTSSARR